VRANVAYGLTVRKLPRDDIARRVETGLGRVNLTGLQNRYPGQLSGGQQQRVALARALVFQPDLLLLDEPLSALDKKLRAELQSELKSLHRRVGMTFIYVTHDQDEALSLSDEVAILRDGSIVQNGSPSELYDHPRTRFVADFLGKSNFIEGVVAGEHPAGFVFEAGPHRLVQAAPSGAPRAGERIVLSLRPEKIVLSADEPAGAGNAMAAEIVSSSYLGADVHVLAAVAGVGTLAVTRPTWRLDVPLNPGKRLWLAWDVDAATRVVDDQPARR